MNPSPRPLLVYAAYAVAVAALAGVFTLYTRPELLVTLSEQVWACFN